MNDGSNIAYRARLDEMWNESKAQIAKAFFKRAIHANMSLARLLDVLSFGDAQPHLQALTLGQALASANLSVNKPTHQEAVVRRPKPVRKRRYARRGPKELQVIKDALLARVQASVGGTYVKQLASVLEKSGLSVDALLVGRLLKELAADGFLDCTPGKPNIWRGRTQGRRAPEPMIIRKAGQAN